MSLGLFYPCDVRYRTRAVQSSFASDVKSGCPVGYQAEVVGDPTSDTAAPDDGVAVITDADYNVKAVTKVEYSVDAGVNYTEASDEDYSLEIDGKKITVTFDDSIEWDETPENNVVRVTYTQITTEAAYLKYTDSLIAVGVALHDTAAGASMCTLVVSGRVCRPFVEAAFGNTLTNAQIVAFCNNGVVID